MSEEILATSGKQLREAREKGVVIPFPSGNAYRVRNPMAAGLLRRGNLPNALLTFTVDAFYSGATQSKVDAFLAAKDKQESALELLDSFRVICAEMFMAPRIVDDPQNDDEATIMDIPMDDQVWAFKLTFLPAEELYPFRPQQETHVVSLFEPENVSSPP